MKNSDTNKLRFKFLLLIVLAVSVGMAYACTDKEKKEPEEKAAPAEIGSLDDLEKALITLGKNPGMTWRFTDNVTVTDAWADAHGEAWYDAVYADSGVYTGGYVSRDLPSFNNLMILAPVNIDLGGYTWDLSVFNADKDTIDFWNGFDIDYAEMGVTGFTIIPDETAGATNIAGGSIIADNIYFKFTDGGISAASYALNLPDTFKTDAQIWIDDNVTGRLVPYDPAVNGKK